MPLHAGCRSNRWVGQMVKPWTVTASRLIHRDRWIDLRADTCVTADGTVIEPFYMTANPDWTCVLPLTTDRRVIAVREYRHGAGRVVTGLPGGIIDAADASAAVAARRELREETGYVCGHLIELGAYFANWAHQSNKMHYFLALDCVRERRASAGRNGGNRGPAAGSRDRAGPAHVPTELSSGLPLSRAATPRAVRATSARSLSCDVRLERWHRRRRSDTCAKIC